MKFIPLLLLLAGCVNVPLERFAELTPADCRAHGIDVADDDPFLGKVVKSKHTSLGGVEKECGEGHAACAKGVEGVFPSPSHRCEVTYADKRCNAIHEGCHCKAGRGDSAHTIKFNLAWMRGDKFAACPS